MSTLKDDVKKYIKKLDEKTLFSTSHIVLIDIVEKWDGDKEKVMAEVHSQLNR